MMEKQKVARHILKSVVNARGMTMISTLIAAGIIVTSLGAIVVPAMQLHKAMKKAEVANAAIVVEANLISSFHNQTNFSNIANNTALRAGTIPAGFSIDTAFGPLVLTAIDATESAGTGFLQRDMTPCPVAAYSFDCVVRYEVRLKRIANGYAFSYQIDANPDVLQMVPLGDIASYTSPVDSGLYRAEAVKTKCDPVTDLFMTGMNRDTGEAYCVERPTTQRCPDGHLPKGFLYTRYPSGPKAGVLTMQCTSAPTRTFSCPSNYGLYKFDPEQADPMVTSAINAQCVFQTRRVQPMPAAIQLPPNPTSPYVRSIVGTVCPPNYNAGNASACQLVPNAARNSDPAQGLGRCAGTAYQNCTRSTYTDTTTSDGGAAYTAWMACMASPPAPPATCGPAPANPVLTTTRTCSTVQTSSNCDGVVTSGSACSVIGGWSSGTPYATGMYDQPPSASTSATFSNRQMTCTFTDTSPPCTAPPLDVSGNPWGRKNPKWYGGVRVQGASCNLDLGMIGSETVPAF